MTDARVSDSDLFRIVEAYGIDKQVDMMLEEMAELEIALLKHRRHGSSWIDKRTGKSARDAVIEETADVLLMAEQVAFIVGRDEVEAVVQEKLERTLEKLRKYVWHQGHTEWHIVCADCYLANRQFQWSGSTRFDRLSEFQEYQESTIDPAVDEAKKCEWCNREFGGPRTEKTGTCQFGQIDTGGPEAKEQHSLSFAHRTRTTPESEGHGSPVTPHQEGEG